MATTDSEYNPFEPDETPEQQDRRIGKMIRENADKRMVTKEAGFTLGQWELSAQNEQGVDILSRDLDGREWRIATVIPWPGFEKTAGLMVASKELYEALQAAEPLLMQLCSVALRKEVADYLPHGLLERVNDWLANSTAQEALSKAVPK